VLKLVTRLRDELGVNTTCGASNISFGLPNRPQLNTALVTMAYTAGLTSAIVNPCRPEMMDAIRAANVIKGVDKDCMSWIKACRAAAAAAAAEEGAK
jgi:5-methyltetrahydrofolate--homocysteine methyltransferase